MAKEKEGEVEEEHSLLSPFSLSGLEGEIDKGTDGGKKRLWGSAQTPNMRISWL